MRAVTSRLRASHAWYAVGSLLLLWGLRGLVLHVHTAQLVHAARLVLLDVGGHDAAFAPACALVGWATARWLPPVARTPVRIGLCLVALFVLLALPSITSAHRLRNPSVLPLHYEQNIGLLVGLVVVGVLVTVMLRLARARWRKSAPPPRG